MCGMRGWSEHQLYHSINYTSDCSEQYPTQHQGYFIKVDNYKGSSFLLKLGVNKIILTFFCLKTFAISTYFHGITTLPTIRLYEINKFSCSFDNLIIIT